MKDIKIKTEIDAVQYIKLLIEKKLQYHFDDTPNDIFQDNETTREMVRLHEELWAVKNPFQILEESEELFKSYIS
jgi:hypothetical protein